METIGAAAPVIAGNVGIFLGSLNPLLGLALIPVGAVLGGRLGNLISTLAIRSTRYSDIDDNVIDPAVSNNGSQVNEVIRGIENQQITPESIGNALRLLYPTRFGIYPSDSDTSNTTENTENTENTANSNNTTTSSSSPYSNRSFIISRMPTLYIRLMRIDNYLQRLGLLNQNETLLQFLANRGGNFLALLNANSENINIDLVNALLGNTQEQINDVHNRINEGLQANNDRNIQNTVFLSSLSSGIGYILSYQFGIVGAFPVLVYLGRSLNVILNRPININTNTNNNNNNETNNDSNNDNNQDDSANID
jgi:hypothetical protein